MDVDELPVKTKVNFRDLIQKFASRNYDILNRKIEKRKLFFRFRYLSQLKKRDPDNFQSLVKQTKAKMSGIFWKSAEKPAPEDVKSSESPKKEPSTPTAAHASMPAATPGSDSKPAAVPSPSPRIYRGGNSNFYDPLKHLTLEELIAHCE